MARKRKLNAALPEAEAEPEAPVATGNMGGMWAGSAMNMLKQRIDTAHGSLRAGILAGTVALELDPAQVRDDLGSDRFGDWQADADFDALLANIERRGQTQPIRVRPVADDWVPDQDNPLITNSEFQIQSGRRRLEACRRLGRSVLAVVATAEGDQALADLEERFHENTMRRNLNGFEELISIGLLAMSLQHMTQSEIAKRLGVGQGDVSLGLACLDYREQILELVDVTETPKRQYRSILPKLKRGSPLTEETKAPAKAARGTSHSLDGVEMRTKQGDKGVSVSVKNANVSQEHLEAMLTELAKVVKKFEGRSKKA